LVHQGGAGSGFLTGQKIAGISSHRRRLARFEIAKKFLLSCQFCVLHLVPPPHQLLPLRWGENAPKDVCHANENLIRNKKILTLGHSLFNLGIII